MSLNRENVIWQSADGTWNRAFYDHYRVNSGEDYDEEWDQEYTDQFHWVSTGHGSQTEAERSWYGANPGGYSVVAYGEATAAQVEHLDDEAAKAYEASELDSSYRVGYHLDPSYFGPPKGRRLTAILEDLNAAKLEAIHYRLENYANMPDPRIPLWEDRVAKMVKPGSLKAIGEAHTSYANALQARIDKMDEHDRRNRGYNFSGSYGNHGALRAKETKRKGLEDAIAEARSQASAFAARAQEPSSSNTAAPDGNEAGGGYHINPETGRPNKCYATKKACPFGGAADHFPSKEAARKGFEKKQGGSF